MIKTLLKFFNIEIMEEKKYQLLEIYKHASQLSEPMALELVLEYINGKYKDQPLAKFNDNRIYLIDCQDAVMHKVILKLGI
jgi:hypothetical protein